MLLLPAYDLNNNAPAQIVSAQANFVKVRVVRSARTDEVLPPLEEMDAAAALTSPAGGEERREGEGAELLCVVRNLLKKMKQRVLVGDLVRLVSVDWVVAQGAHQLLDVTLKKGRAAVEADIRAGRGGKRGAATPQRAGRPGHSQH